MPRTTPIVPGLFSVDLGPVNAFLAETRDGLVLVDTGSPGAWPRLEAAIRALGHAPADLAAVVVTHHHPDHAGSLADVLAATGAEAWMHPADAAEVRAGNGFRPYRTTSGLLNLVLERVFIRPVSPHIPPAAVAHEVDEGDALPGGLVAVHAPGHSRGQIALLWPETRVLFAADACSNLPVLGYSIIHEDFAEARATLRRLATLDFDTAAFGHGKAIVGGAAARFRERFGGA